MKLDEDTQEYYLDDPDDETSMTMHVALETISSKHGEKWEPWRATAREL